MSAIRIAVAALGVAVTVSRHPAVRAGMRAMANHPKTREIAIGVTREAAYTAGVVTRHLVGRRLQ